MATVCRRCQSLQQSPFPHSREVVSKLFDGIEISEAEKADILGGNGVRLFRLHA